jgi:hypothetical protein
MEMIKSLFYKCLQSVFTLKTMGFIAVVKWMTECLRRHRLMKMDDIIPALKKMNVNVKHEKPDDLTKGQLHAVFHIVGEILEDQPAITVEDQEALAKYKNDFLTRRVLQAWEKIRFKIYLNSPSTGDKTAILAELFEEIKPMLFKSFVEEYSEKGLPLNPLTFRAFVWNQAYIARKFHIYKDQQYWNEIIEMIDTLKEQCFENRQKKIF